MGDSKQPSNEDYIHTTTHNYISRQATIEGARQVKLKGRNIIAPNVYFHGSLAPIHVGQYCRFDSGVVIEPPTMMPEGTKVNIKIGSKSWIGESSRIEAAAVGSLCWIGKNVTLGPRSILKDCVVIADNTVIPADTIIPPFSHIRRNKEGILRRTELPPASSAELEEKAVEYYQTFVAKRGTK